MQIRLAASASRDLDDIKAYIAQDKPEAATVTVARILQSLSYLEEFPRLGRIGMLPETRELSIRGLPFRAIYRIEGDVVLVLTIIHTSRKLP